MTAIASDYKTGYSPRMAWAVLAVMISVNLTLDMVRQPIYFLTDPVRATFHMSDVQLSLLLGAVFAVPSMVMSLIGGWLCDRVSRRLLMGAAMSFWIIGAGLFATSGSADSLFVGRCLIGLGTGIHAPVAITWITDAFPAHKRGKVNGVFFIVLSIGPALGGAVTGSIQHFVEGGGFAALPVLGGLESWRITVMMLTLPSALALLLLWPLHDGRGVVGQPDVGAGAGEEGKRSHAMPWSVIAMVIGATALMNLVDATNLAWLPAVLKRQFNYGPQQVGLAFAVIAGIGGIAGPMTGGWLGDRVFARHGTSGRIWLTAGMAVVCSVLLLSYLSKDAYFLIAGLALNGMLTVGVLVLGYVGLQAIVPQERRGLSTGIMSATGSMFAAAGPTLVALISERLSSGGGALGYATALVCASLSAVAALAFAVTACTAGRAVSAPARAPGLAAQH